MHFIQMAARYSNLMDLMVSVAQPHLGQQPVIARVVGCPYRVCIAGLLVELDGNRDQVAGWRHIEQPERLRCEHLLPLCA